MSRLITSVHELSSCDVKVYYSHENYNNNDVFSDVLVDLNNNGYSFGIIESYIGAEPLEHFKSMVLSQNVSEQPAWYDFEAIDYAIVEVSNGNINFYHAGDCEIYLCINNTWYDFYDLVIEGVRLKDSQLLHPILGFSKYIEEEHITEILLSSTDVGIKVEDLNDRILEDYDFMSDVILDETNDMHIIHVDFNK